MPTALVTGASGFIATHCVVELLRAGYDVRGTIRSAARGEALRAALAAHGGALERLELHSADLTADAGWKEAVAGCDYVLHVASPLPKAPPRHEDELIVPARDGTLRVLRAAADAGVKRVVMTSSLGAVVSGDRPEGRPFDERDWPDPERAAPYEKSKTLAERAAWDFVRQDGRLELVAINPGLVLGPVLVADTAASIELVRRLLARELPACPRFGSPIVDVRDVAAAHLAAMTTPAAAGQRFCCAIEHTWLIDIAQILDRHFRARGFRVPTRTVPDFVVRLFALLDKTTRGVIHTLGRRDDVSTARIREVLGWQPRSAEEMVTASAETLIALGVVSAPRPPGGDRRADAG